MITDNELLEIAIDEAIIGRDEGGIPIGAALVDAAGNVLGSGHNRRIQDNDPSVHGETAAFRAAGRQTDYRCTTMVTTLAPCWYCSGLIIQFGIGRVIVGQSQTFSGGIDWLANQGVQIVDLNDSRCVDLMDQFIAKHPEIWYEDIGQPYQK